MKRILLLATGGTIAALEKKDGLSPGLSPEDLLAAVPDITDYCTVDTEQLVSLDSTNIQPEHWVLFAQAIGKRYDDYDAFIITHGTDTLAYTAGGLSYLIQNSEKPIVLTGAQRPIWAGGSDGPKNLLDSFFFATRSGAGGVYIVFGGKAILGTRARKVKSMSYSAFDSINYPVLAYIHHRQIVSYPLVPEPAAGAVRFYDQLNPGVCLLKLTPGMPADVLDYLGKSHDAVILESFGTGGLPFAFHETAGRLARTGCTLVLSTQVALEGSDIDVYQVGRRISGLEGILEAYDMTAEAALSKLMWILPQANSADEIRQLFYTPVYRDIYLPHAELTYGI